MAMVAPPNPNFRSGAMTVISLAAYYALRHWAYEASSTGHASTKMGETTDERNVYPLRQHQTSRHARPTRREHHE